MSKVTQKDVEGFGDAMKLALATRGMTLKMLANAIRDEEAGFNPTIQYLSGVQNGGRKAGAKTVGRIVRELDLDPKWTALFAGVASPAPATPEETRADGILDAAEKAGLYEKLLGEGITEKAIIRLAQRIAREIEDVGQAWLELQNAMDIAVRVQQDGKTGSNHEGFVDEVLRRVADLAAEGEYERANAETDQALEHLDARKSRVLQQGVEVALLTGDTERATRLLVRQADLDAGGIARFESLKAFRSELESRGIPMTADL